MAPVLSLLSLLFTLSNVFAGPLLQKRSDFTDVVGTLIANAPADVTAADVTALSIKPATYLAGASYCRSVREKKTWTCGAACAGVADVQVLYTDGDSTDTPFVYVGYSPSLKAVVVSHAGTNSSSIENVLENLDFELKPLDKRLTSLGAPSAARAHDGFHSTWVDTSDGVLSAVQSALAGVGAGATQVIVTGHSLGAALSLFDGIRLKAVLPATANVKTILFGLPRVGNEAFANWASSLLGTSQIHIVSENDIVPHLPPLGVGYRHPGNEIWERDNTNAATGNARFCSSGESYSCSNSYLVNYSAGAHEGPYMGTKITGRDGCQ